MSPWIGVGRAAALACVVVLAAGCGKGDDEGPAIPLHVVGEGTLSRVISAEGNLRAVSATPIAPPPIPGVFRPMKLAWIAEDGTRVKKGDVVIRFDPTGLEQQLESGTSDHVLASAQLAKQQIEGKSAAAKRDVSAKLADLALEKTKRFSERDEEIYSRNQIIEAEVDEGLSLARREHAEAAKAIERRLSQSKAELARVSQRRAKMDIDRASAGLAALEVHAPHDGLLVLHRNWRGDMPRVGESAWPGRKLAEIPDLSAMEAEIYILEVDGGGLKEGTAVTVTIEAQPGREFSGTISHVDDLAKERVRGVPVQYFAAVVSLDETDAAVMKPGQRVRARLTLDDETGILIPRSAVFVVDGDEVVFVKTPTGFEPRPVELGASSSARVVVKTGLTIGEEIALVDPRAREAEGGSGSGSPGGESS